MPRWGWPLLVKGVLLCCAVLYMEYFETCRRARRMEIPGATGRSFDHRACGSLQYSSDGAVLDKAQQQSIIV